LSEVLAVFRGPFSLGSEKRRAEKTGDRFG
jgi:hypothetical protein